MDSSELDKTKASGIIPFVTEVARYFMDFLETDFHKVRNPKRHIQYRNSSNLQTCIDLNKYKKFTSLIWKVIRAGYKDDGSGFKDDSINTLKPGMHTLQISKSLSQLIEEQIKIISSDDIKEIINQIEVETSVSLAKHQNDTDAAINYALDGISRIIRENFVSKFISKIQEPINKITDSTVDSVYQIEEELTQIIVSPLEEVVTIIINDKKLERNTNSHELLSQAIDLIDLKYKLSSFFRGFSVSDLFFEVSELFSNKNLLEKQEFYIYFCDIKFGNHTYPLFYIPMQIQKTKEGFEFNYDSLLYVNKRAIQFVKQNYTALNDKNISMSTFIDRIIYLSEKGQHLIGEIDQALKEAITYFGLNPYIDINNPEKQTSKGREISISNHCYMGIFDKSDESLVNDYEEILQKLKEGHDGLAITFQNIIDDFITNNPISCNFDIEGQWNNTAFDEKLVYKSPVPLNDEQRKILIATNKSDCKYITVQGPPGTGKSHTITAIVCEAILKNQSVLVLSDKKEALDVVEGKITDTMNKVRLDADFQNPVLRLGQTGNTYSKILSISSMEKIKDHYSATRSVYQKVEKDIDETDKNLKDNLSSCAASYENVKLSEISEFQKLESDIICKIHLPIDIAELYSHDKSHDDILNLRNEMASLKRSLSNDEYNLIALFKNIYKDDQRISSFLKFIRFIEIINILRVKAKNDVSYLSKIRNISTEHVKNIEEFIFECEQIKLFIFGYLFCGEKVKILITNFNNTIPNDFHKPHHKLDELSKVISVFREIDKLKKSEELGGGFEFSFDFIKAAHSYLALDVKIPTNEECKKIIGHINGIKLLLREYNSIEKKLISDPDNINCLLENDLVNAPIEDFTKLIRYLNLYNTIHHKFNSIPAFNYKSEKESIEELVTTQMTYKVDERVVDFFENHRNDARALSGVISKKQRFDKSVFNKLKNAFPCILAGIRDFAEYIPLESDLFDLVIIDEASQVSIAQALPALLRGKKIIVLGDKRQFSNVKSAQARSTINQEYLNRIKDVFVTTISEENIKLERLGKFNIKTSILEFFERITNYNVMLKKHFRGYRELISYSNKYFYDDVLQAIKIRTKLPDDIIKISFIEHDNRLEPIENTNQLEIDMIVNEVERIFKEESNLTVGILTPHTNQHKLLQNAFSRHPDFENFESTLKLKIMTFDTCQGEERDIIIYSMVGNPVSDHLWGVFIKDRNTLINHEEGAQIKLQRLNVGFSRAKERMHFFLSKPIEEFTGSIGEALSHYKKTLEEANSLPSMNDTDPNSPMEKRVLSWIQDTSFFKINRSSIELHAQFPLGEYLKQLDRRYNHPKYVADFLLIYSSPQKITYKIIIEYDGFEFHFQDNSSVNELNYDEYYTDEHIYREKVLESYGCVFLRINRFNLGKDPIETLSQRLEQIVNDPGRQNTHIVSEIHNNISGMQDGELKECSKCNQIKPLIDFRDNELVTGYGRHCNTCKDSSKQDKSTSNIPSPGAHPSVDVKCPLCSSPMLIRTRKGDQHQFYGCSKFPRCRGTKSIEAKS